MICAPSRGALPMTSRKTPDIPVIWPLAMVHCWLGLPWQLKSDNGVPSPVCWCGMSMHSTLFVMTICAASPGLHPTVRATSTPANPADAFIIAFPSTLAFISHLTAVTGSPTVGSRPLSRNLPHRLESPAKRIVVHVHPTPERLVHVLDRQHDQGDQKRQGNN